MGRGNGFACSYAYAISISFASLYATPWKMKPTGLPRLDLSPGIEMLGNLEKKKWQKRCQLVQYEELGIRIYERWCMKSWAFAANNLGE